MLITPIQLSKLWGITPKSILHVGAHRGEERFEYDAANWAPIIWIEAQKALANDLANALKGTQDIVLNAAIWNISGEKLELNISSNSGSSSLLEFGSHKNSYPEITFETRESVVTSRLDDLLAPYSIPNFLNLDIQGVELQALQSLGRKLELIDFIYVEINTKDVYLGCTKLWELDDFLATHGFQRKATRRYLRHGWGEALYCRTGKYKLLLWGLPGRSKLFLRFYGTQVMNFIKGFFNELKKNKE
jgi:FkbM family methyltransferase